MISRLTILLVAAAIPGLAVAELPTRELAIINHRFEPQQIEIAAGEKIRLIVKNKDQTPEEFESYDLNREKIVGPGSEISVIVGPLTPGEYKFFGEFNQETAQGKLIVAQEVK